MTFLPFYIHFLFVTTVSCLSFLGMWTLSLVGLVLYIVIFFMFRKGSVRLDDNFEESGQDLFVAPVSGNVLSIEEGSLHNIIQFRINFWNEYSIRAPKKGEIKKLEYRNSSSFKFCYFSKMATSSSDLDLIISEDFGDGEVLIGFKRCFLGFSPTFKVIPGDRAMIKALLGFFPLGGPVFLYLPKKYKISLELKQRVAAGETVIATLG